MTKIGASTEAQVTAPETDVSEDIFADFIKLFKSIFDLDNDPENTFEKAFSTEKKSESLGLARLFSEGSAQTRAAPPKGHFQFYIDDAQIDLSPSQCTIKPKAKKPTSAATTAASPSTPDASDASERLTAKEAYAFATSLLASSEMREKGVVLEVLDDDGNAIPMSELKDENDIFNLLLVYSSAKAKGLEVSNDADIQALISRHEGIDVGVEIAQDGFANGSDNSLHTPAAKAAKATLDAVKAENFTIPSPAAEAPKASGDLAEAIQSLWDHSVNEQDAPSYKYYNESPFKEEISAEMFFQAFLGNYEFEDARALAIMAHYYGDDAQDEVIVSQQVVRVLNAISHFSGNEAEFAKHLENNLRVPTTRAADLAKLAPMINQAFKDLPLVEGSYKDRGQDNPVKVPDLNANPSIIEAVALITESVQNWENQKENFLDTAHITRRLLGNDQFRFWAMDAVTKEKPLSGAPQVGLLQAIMDYKNNAPLDETDKSFQALFRIMTLPPESIELAQLKYFHDEKACANPYPIFKNRDTGKKEVNAFVQPYASDVQTAAWLMRGLADAQANLNEDETKQLTRLRIAWSIVSAREILHVYKQKHQQALKHNDHEIAEKIDGMMAYTHNLLKAADKLAQSEGLGNICDALDDKGYDESEFHQNRANLLGDTAALFKGYIERSSRRNKAAVLERFKEVMHFTDKQREIYLAKLDTAPANPAAEPKGNG